MLGEPWRIILGRFAGLFKSLGFLQILVIDVYLGGFFLYAVAVIPLHLFAATALYAITILSAIAALFFHWRRVVGVVHNLSLHPKSTIRNHLSFEPMVVASLFLLSLSIQTLPFNYLLFGSVRDTSLHSLFVQVLIENRQVPETVQPYSSAGIVYPQGFTPIAAYSTFVLGYLPPQAILYLTALFNSLTILGAYFLGKALSKKWNLGLGLAFIFTFVASWPKYITWGSNPFVASFPLYFVCLSFLPYLVRNKTNLKTIFAIGLVFGYLSVLHLQTYETLIASLFILWLYITLKREKTRWSGLRNLIIVTGVSLLILSPFLYRAAAFYSYPYHNEGLPADVEIPIPQPSIAIILTGITSFYQNLANSVLLRVLSIVLLCVSALTIVSFRRKSGFTQTSGLVVIGVASLLGQLLILLFAAVSAYDLPFYAQPLLLYLPIYFFVAAFTVFLYNSFSSCLSKKVLSEAVSPKPRARVVLVAAIASMLVLGIYAPFLYQSLVLDAGDLYGSYAVFGVTTEQDLQLILSIRDTLPQNATILVNTFQGGTFIPSIANRKAVFLSSAESYSVSYQRLVTMLEENVINATTLDLMKYLGVTNIYVGSGVSGAEGWIHRWNPKLFLGNPNFKLVKNFGDAYLFQFAYAASDLIFLDDFEHSNWDQNGWQTQYYGNGVGNVTTTAEFGYHSQKCLKISAQAIYTVSEWKYARAVSREFFVPNNTDVTLSFYLKATNGFHGKDTFAVVISNAYNNQSMIMTTPNGVYEGYANAKTLSSFGGLFSDNLSESWRQLFHSSLPNTFILEFVNWDFDGIENIAYVDNVNITVTPLS
jgi:hypothetical protein